MTGDSLQGKSGGEDAEVIVIGGGAAGTSTAINLARRGRRVILLEGREPGPPTLSDLHSGEVFSPGSQAELARLGLPVADDSSAHFLDRWKLQEWDTLLQHWPGGRRTLDRLPGGRCYWQLNRGRFYQALQHLARREGVEVRTGARVIDLLRDSAGTYQGVIVRQSDQATGEMTQHNLFGRMVVDASGRNSVVVARLALREPEPHLSRAAYIFFFSEINKPEIEPGVWEQFWLSGSTTLRGSWLAPGLYRYAFETSLAERSRWLARYGRLAPYELFQKVVADLLPPAQARPFQEAARLPHTLAFAPIGYRVSQLAHDGLLMVGDAAGYLDPSTGQGLEFALRMGRLAANTIDQAFAANRFDQAAFNSYLVGWQSEVQPTLRNLRLMLRLSRQNWLLDSVARFGPVRRTIVRQLTTPRPPTI